MEKVAIDKWERWRRESIIEDNETLLEMMREVTSAAKTLRSIDLVYYRMVVYDLCRVWQTLETIARTRKLTSFPEWI